MAVFWNIPAFLFATDAARTTCERRGEIWLDDKVDERATLPADPFVLEQATFIIGFVFDL